MTYLSNRYKGELEKDLVSNKPYWELTPKELDAQYHAIDKEVSDVLERLRMIGRLFVDPLIIGLTVPLDIAYEEVKYQMERPEMTKSQFQKILDRNQIYNVPHIDDLWKLEAKLSRSILTAREANMLKTRLQTLADAIEVSKNNIQLKAGKMALAGKAGEIFLLGDHTHVSVIARNKRHMTSIEKQLAFMEFVKADNLDMKRFAVEFRLDRLPTSDEAETIRKLVGLKKSPQKRETLTPQLRGYSHNEGAIAL